MQAARHNVKAEMIERRHELLGRHAELGSVFKRKGARRWLDEHAPGTAGLQSEQVTVLGGVLGRLATGPGRLRRARRAATPQGSDRYDPTVVTNYLGRLRRAVSVAQGVEAARAAARGQTRLRLAIEPLMAELTQESIDRDVERWQRALTAVGADRAGNELKENTALLWLNGRLKDPTLPSTRNATTTLGRCCTGCAACLRRCPRWRSGRRSSRARRGP